MLSNKRSDIKILFIGKQDDEHAAEAARFLEIHFKNTTVISGKRGDKFPDEALRWKGDLIISYLSQWIIPKNVLEAASFAAFNFHPGPPEYPGIGCTNFAVYNGENIFGVTCHHMEPQVDTGKIIAVRRFPVFEEDTVLSITRRCYSAILQLFYEIFYMIMADKQLPESDELWKRKPFLRKELDDLCRLTPAMSPEEIQRRLKATHYIKDWAYFDIDNKIYKISN